MARENTFLFFGELVGAPVVLFNDETGTYRLNFMLKTVRRNGREDFPKISIYSLTEKKAREYIANLKPGVFVQVRGMVATKMVKKPVQCEGCGQVSNINTLVTEIITYGKPFVLNVPINPTEIVEFANVGNLLGAVCTDINRNDTAKGGTAVQFQMAVHRRYKISELEKEDRTDYPWVKAFGETANECIKRLQKSSQIYVTGAFQTRDIQRHVRCSHCGKDLMYTERVGEISPNGIEFLHNCLFVPREEKQTDSGEGQAHEKA